ncbi:hypothetical protein E0E52_09800 [Azotobacter chroococcum]|uniref:hypothetical protein n=1 Tax=Azotobacter chroococcum TaxID=353 RepID=UPI0010395EDC|nr:hypothetical protein [Azotobacter chroococcum]TBW08061.1 hypothetical protein E0E52_09800 [Azotobacter chroococcum]
MSTGILSKAISNLVEAQSEKKSEGFTIVNVRPGEKVSAMLDVIAYLYQKSPSVLIADALSQKIATHAASSLTHADAIINAAGQVISEHGILHENSALGILKKQGLLKVRNPYMKDIDLGSIE